MRKAPDCGLTFSRLGGKLSADSGSAPSGGRFPSSFQWLFQQRIICKPASFPASFALKRNIPARDRCVFVSCWAFLCRFSGQVLAGPTDGRMGFVRLFCFSDAISCVIVHLSPRPPNARIRLFRQSSSPHSRKSVHPAGAVYTRKG